MRRLLTILLAVAAAGGLAGCGINNPYTTDRPQRTVTSRTSTLRATSPSPPSATTATGSTGAVALLRRYATLSINWTSHTLAGRQRELAGLAVGGARAQAVQTASSYGTGSSLQRSRVGDRGQITSIAAGQGPREGWWVITTQETTTGTGNYQHLPSQTHVYDAQLTYTHQQLTVRTWSPQN
jgi:hypothetical protein